MSLTTHEIKYWYDLIVYDIDPVAKPRMTRQDKWPNPPRNYRGKQWPRPSVAKYFAFVKQVRFLCKVELPLEGALITFGLPMPRSWSEAKKEAMEGQPHQQKPDLSNLIKALEDACFDDDSAIWNYGGLSKLWAREGYISVARPSSFMSSLSEAVEDVVQQNKAKMQQICPGCGEVKGYGNCEICDSEQLKRQKERGWARSNG